jgi:secreted trypsin-like serine protease
VRIVGYGTSSHQNTGSGTKRTATTTIVDYDNVVVLIGTSSRQTCHGDSGGPALQTLNGKETVIGVTSYGMDRSSGQVCYGGGYDTRIDRYADFITAHL